jgi:hypothetical protein
MLVGSAWRNIGSELAILYGFRLALEQNLTKDRLRPLPAIVLAVSMK